jgi:hypothetical protein
MLFSVMLQPFDAISRNAELLMAFSGYGDLSML